MRYCMSQKEQALLGSDEQTKQSLRFTEIATHPIADVMSLPVPIATRKDIVITTSHAFDLMK